MAETQAAAENILAASHSVHKMGETFGAVLGLDEHDPDRHRKILEEVKAFPSLNFDDAARSKPGTSLNFSWGQTAEWTERLWRRAVHEPLIFKFTVLNAPNDDDDVRLAVETALAGQVESVHLSSYVIMGTRARVCVALLPALNSSRMAVAATLTALVDSPSGATSDMGGLQVLNATNNGDDSYVVAHPSICVIGMGWLHSRVCLTARGIGADGFIKPALMSSAEAAAHPFYHIGKGAPLHATGDPIMLEPTFPPGHEHAGHRARGCSHACLKSDVNIGVSSVEQRGFSIPKAGTPCWFGPFDASMTTPVKKCCRANGRMPRFHNECAPHPPARLHALCPRPKPPSPSPCSHPPLPTLLTHPPRLRS